MAPPVQLNEATMPFRAPRLCTCGFKIAAGELCPCERRRAADARAKHDKGRPSSHDRGYDAAWRKLRAAFLEANPICCVEDCGLAATDADHILSVRIRPDLRLVWSNLRAYCHAHHSRRTAREQGFASN